MRYPLSRWERTETNVRSTLIICLKKKNIKLMPTSYQQITVNALIDKTKGTASAYDYAQVRGFHIYCDLTLNLRLSAAEDDKNSMLFLELLQDYAAVADSCAKQVGAHVLEIQ